jgi:hypothetical protein
LLWNPDKIDNNEDLFKVGMETKSKYTQAISIARARNQSYIEERYNPPKSSALRTMDEENSELAEFLENIGDWNFDTLALNTFCNR